MRAGRCLPVSFALGNCQRTRMLQMVISPVITQLSSIFCAQYPTNPAGKGVQMRPRIMRDATDRQQNRRVNQCTNADQQGQSPVTEELQDRSHDS